MRKIVGLLVALGMVFWLAGCSLLGRPALGSPLTGPVSRRTVTVTVTPTQWFPEPTQNEARPTVTQTPQAALDPVEPSPTQAKPSATPAQKVGGVNAKEARSAVLKSLDAVRQAGPYRVISTITSESGAQVRSTSEVILPDRFHLISNEQETLVIGSTTYILQNGKWVLFPADMSRILSGMIGANEAEHGLSAFQWVGSDTLDGSTATVYQYEFTRQVEGAPLTSTVKIWVDSDTGLPVRQEIEGTASGAKLQTEQVIEYDSSIRIEEP